MKGRRLLGLALWVASAAVGAVSASSAGATAPSGVAWWHRPLLESPNGLPVPDIARQPLVPVPPGGLYVANDASGPRATAAVGFSDDATAGVLLLRLAGEAFIPVGAALVACPVAPTWDAVQNGPWDERPDLDCNAAVPGRFVDDRTAVTFDLADLAPFRTSRGIEIGLAPAQGEVAAFALAFEPPSPDAFTAALSAAPTTASTVQPPTTEPGIDPSSGGRLGPLATPPSPAVDAPSQVAALPLPAEPPRESTISLARISTDGAARAGLTAALAVAAAGAWLVSGRAPRTEET